MTTCPTCQRSVPAGASVCPHDGTPLVHQSLVGQVLGERYRILRQLGQGGMGTVYLAEHVVLGKRFAIKVLRPELSQREDLVKRFQQEAIAASRIGQENIVDVVDFGRTPEGRLYFAMEALEGECLTDLLRKHGRLPLARAFGVLGQIAKALGAAHSQGIVHRDVKPDNVILVAREGGDLAKVLDFGISMVSGDHPDGERITRAGTIIGTPEYMSPEQAEGGDIDHRTDVYAWGVLAYEVLTGTLPFCAKSSVDLLVAHRVKPPEPLSTRCPEAQIPAEVESLVLQALAKSPEDRPQSMTELARSLGQLGARLAGLPAPTPAPPGLTPASSPAKRATPSPFAPTIPDTDDLAAAGFQPRRRGLMVVASGAGLLALLSAAAVVLWPTSPTPDPALTAISVPAGRVGPAEVAAMVDPPPLPADPIASAGPAGSARVVQVTSVPPGAQVSSKAGKVLGITPLQLEVLEGTPLVLRFTLDGYRPARRRVGGDVGALEVRLVKPHPQSPAEDDDGFEKLDDLKDPYR
ncbi:MAG: protein kinase [Deltaproteobacteria bacterium]|nr:protein kinase [Deltaproteobacteria bacterium]